MTLESDPLGGWEFTQPARTDTQLPRVEPPLVMGDPEKVWLVCLIGVIVLCVVIGWLAFPDPAVRS